jgi:hypothetical protein
MLSRIQIAAILGLIILPSIYLKGRYDGSNACDARHDAAQIKQTEKVRRTHAKIKHDAPGDSDKHDAIEWLLTRTRK